MTVYYNDTQRNAMLDALAYTGAKLHLYAGAVPADEAAALGGATKLAEFTLAPNAAAAGARQLVPTTLETTAIAGAPSNAAFYRIYNSANTVCMEQGSVTATGGGGDMTVDNVSIATGQTVRVTGFNKTAPG